MALVAAASEVVASGGNARSPTLRNFTNRAPEPESGALYFVNRDAVGDLVVFLA